MEWRYSGSSSPQIFRVQKSTGNLLASIFWEQDSILLIDYLPKGQTINAAETAASRNADVKINKSAIEIPSLFPLAQGMSLC